MNSYINARHFKSPIDVWGNFVPGLLFMQSIFGYLVLCIVYKWSVDWSATDQQPPGILNLLIYMFLSPGNVTEKLYSGQVYVQQGLLIIAMICVPWLLLLKPFYLRWENKRHRGLGYRGLGEASRVSALDDRDSMDGNGHAMGRDSFEGDGDTVALVAEEADEEEEFDFGDVMIHQTIHTIGE